MPIWNRTFAYFLTDWADSTDWISVLFYNSITKFAPILRDCLTNFAIVFYNRLVKITFFRHHLDEIHDFSAIVGRNSLFFCNRWTKFTFCLWNRLSKFAILFRDKLTNWFLGISRKINLAKMTCLGKNLRRRNSAQHFSLFRIFLSFVHFAQSLYFELCMCITYSRERRLLFYYIFYHYF